jgi:4-amino-4-deoxy-L-arabinose transferase-like glycosyltransferase
MPSERARRLALAAILVLSTGAKLALVAPARETEPVRDAFGYVLAAQTLASEGRYDSNKGPLYPALLAAALWLGGRDPWSDPRGLDAARLAQVALSALGTWLVYRLGRELFDDRAGLAAAAIYAFEPTLVAYTQLLWSETLLALPMAAALWSLARGVRGGRALATALAGAGFGIAALTRSVVLTLLPLVALWILAVGVRPRRAALRHAAALALGAALVVAPWTLRNALAYGRFVPISPFSGTVLIFGASAEPLREFERAWARAPREADRVDLDRIYWEHGLAIVRRDPAAYARRAFTVNLPNLWAPGSSAIEYLRPPHGYPAPDWLWRGTALAAVGAYLAVMALAIAGGALAPDWRATLLVALLAAGLSAVHLIGGAYHRHRLVLAVYAVAWAGYAASRRPSEWRALRESPRRLALGALALAAFAGLLAAAPWPRL